MAYAAVLSLKLTIQRLLNSCHQIPILPPYPQILQLAYDEVESFETIFCSKESNSKRTEALERQIREAAFRLEDVLESAHVSDQHFLSQSQTPDGVDISYLAMKVKEEIDFFTETVKKITEQLSNPSASLLAEEDDELVSSTTAGHSQEKKSFIFPSDHDELIRLKDMLSFSRRLEVVSIVGMAGIGKTALAKQILEDSYIRGHFNLLVFASVGPKSVLREIMLDLLAKIGVEIDKTHEQSDQRQLGVAFYEKLYGSRYLIVLDDIWDQRCWHEVTTYLPDNHNGSRIIITTRLEQVARSAGPYYLNKRFLNQQESWLLFCDKVFGRDHSSCPSELEKAGRKIVKKCEGLPLSIIAVARHLHDAEKTPEYWKQAAKKVHTAIIGADKAASKVLYKSYKYLPEYLKPCFLYIGVFPHDSDITASKLIKLWCAEGFLQQYGIQTSLEDSAMESLETLVSSNVVKVRQPTSFGGIKTCNVYPPFWHICVREAGKHKFFHVIDSIGNQGIESQRRLCIHNNALFGIKNVRKSTTSTPNVRSLLCTGPHHQYPVPINLDFSLLRVLDALTIRFYSFPSAVVKLVELRYLAITYNGVLPDSISKLRYLQYLIVHQYLRIIYYGNSRSYLPMEVWTMHELRHLEVMGSDMPDPSSEDVLLPNLLTLSGISTHSCTKEVLGPKLPAPFFPVSLRKLTLGGLGLPWEDMSLIACLPNLEVLKLRCYAFRGPEWETFEGGFWKLRVLLIEDTDLEYWRANGYRFPRLERLFIHHCYKLKEIPQSIEENFRLEVIEIVDGTPSLVASAKQIQHAWGFAGLQVCVKSTLEENGKGK
ncbi:putative late blight resistance protein homolog R1B-17 [Sesamum indicum]|uniref:Late blight resistance protein homolog R1B-17 n=1 Tax=Sesamum indicum TaxID=4182 RepID=A0A8M8UZ91_SESIN|nr:putative late blight resistance protein homolog R1B-17 [Sesamum indicum]